MIKLHTPNGAAMYVATHDIVRIHEAGASSQWFGIKSFIKTGDGRTLDVRETPEEVRRLMKESKD